MPLTHKFEASKKSPETGNERIRAGGRIYWYGVDTKEGERPMRSYREDETARQADPKGDVDDLIFRAGPDWTASQR